MINGPPEKRLLELEREQWRRTCRGNLIAFAIEALASAKQQPARHHRLICERLMQLVGGELKDLESVQAVVRMMCMAPPGSSKTTYVSRLFPAWYFALHPRSNIIGVSHVASLS
jgi:hypothetical protein